jgi:Fe-S cluster assembly ATP-binding protein
MLEVKNICFEANDNGKKKSVLKNISLRFDDNQFIVITGPNGSGKSTLAKILMGINIPTKGDIFFGGEDITKLSITERAKKGISFSFQQPVRIKGVTVKDLLEAAGGKDFDKLLKTVGLPPEEYLNRELSGTLSGGELKRIEIASVLARNTDVMIFDEPEAGIDLWSFNDLVDVFKKIRKDKIIIIISHQERIIKLADRVLVLENGLVSKECSPEEFLKGVA